MKERISISIGISIIIVTIWRILLIKREGYVILKRITWMQVIIILSIMVWNIIEMYSIIRILNKDMEQGWLMLAKISNVIGEKYIDIYKIYADKLEKSIALGVQYLKEFIKQLGMGTIGELLKEDGIVKLEEANTFRKLLHYFMYCEISEMPKLIAEINKTINILEKQRTWKYIHITFPTEIYWMLNKEIREIIQGLPENNQNNNFIK